MAFSYNKLWKLLIDKKMMKKDLMAKTNLTSTTLAKMSKDLPVSMDVLGRICKALDVNIGDIVDYVEDEKSNHNWNVKGGAINEKTMFWYIHDNTKVL